MKDNMLVFTCLGLLLHWILPVTSMKLCIPLFKKNCKIPLNMAENSVDDMYFNCFKDMTTAVEEQIFQEELMVKTLGKDFSEIWKTAEGCAEENMNKINVEKGLTKNHMQAICLYTADYTFEDDCKFYSIFNTAVRTRGRAYPTNYQYRSFHFWLTSAIQILRDHQRQCYNTYRRTSVKFKGKVNKRIRFGSFASTSMLDNLNGFGKETCFCVHTCYGASLKDYSKFGVEEEVLIPPYEIFMITKKNDSECLPDCKVRYTLKSAGILSNQNCKVVKS